jgi:SAM-dependent methyltransferase
VPMPDPYYRPDLARVHHQGFAFHAAAVAPGVLQVLAPVLESGGLVVEFGCGSGLLTRELVAAGHRVLATDASPAMLALAHETAPGAVGFAVVALPDDPLPRCDAIVGVGHPINYLPSLEAIHLALGAMADALRPGGIVAFDVCDLAYGQTRRDVPSRGWASDDWALVTEFSLPSADRFVRQMTIFSRNDDGTWRRDDERHDNVLVDTATIPDVLRVHGVDAEVCDAFGREDNPTGLKVVVGRKAGSAGRP